MDVSTAAELALVNLTSVPVLAFALGILAITLLRVDLRLPEAVYRAMSIYLLLAIGLKGGVALREAGISGLVAPALAGIMLGILIPIAAYNLLGVLTRLSTLDRGAMAAYYGSTSLVTFTAALTLIESIGLPIEGHVATLVVVMEIPGLVIGLALAQRARSRAAALSGAPREPSTGLGGVALQTHKGDGEQGDARGALREALTGPSVLLMAGGLLIGYVAGPSGYEAVSPVFTGLFTGILALFLLHLGVTAGSRLGMVRQAGPGLVLFATAFPLIVGAIGVLVGAAVGMGTGGAAVLGVLCASASYIAAPAAVGLALPEADTGLCLTSSLALTFPFNLLVGVPALITLSMVVIGT